MSAARNRIFARIAEARGAAMPSIDSITAERDALVPDEGATQPTFTEQDTIARFKAWPRPSA